MYYELYIDVLFLVNFLMDYILLLIAKKVLRRHGGYGRLCLGALAGSLFTCFVTAVRIPYPFVKFILFYGAAPAVMLGVSFPIRNIRSFLRGLSTLYISGFLVGGVFGYLSQYVQVGSLFFALAIGSYYLTSGVLRMLALLFHFGEAYCHLTLYKGERICEADAMIDTGNHLTDRVSGKAVSIVSREVAKQLFDRELPEGIRYIPYRTIGKGKGVIPVVPIDRISIDGDEIQWIEQPMIAISENSSFGNEYEVILNPDI